MKQIAALIVFALLSCSKREKAENIQIKEGQTAGDTVVTDASPSQKSSPKTSEPVKEEITAEPWQSERTYEEGDTVKQDDTFWIANRKVYQNTPPPDSWFWRPLSGSSENEISYNAGLAYDSGAVVLFNGKKYEARRKVFLNTTPADSWFWKEIIAE